MVNYMRFHISWPDDSRDTSIPVFSLDHNDNNILLCGKISKHTIRVYKFVETQAHRAWNYA